MPPFDRRPVIVAVAGPNGAGKTTFFHAHLQQATLPFVNADGLADPLQVDTYDAARLADAIRRALLARRESFVFETVFSDPVGDKPSFLQEAAESGHQQRVAMRASQGGHDVPDEKLYARFSRTLENLKIAARELPHVLVYDTTI